MTQRSWSLLVAMACCWFVATPVVWAGTPFVPGTGDFMDECSDDFEDPDWGYKLNLPKSSEEQDKQERGPGGRSTNGLWTEGAKRGTPDVVKRVDTPPGGIEGSTGALLFATKNSGIPGKVTNEQQQDDLLLKFDRKLSKTISVAWRPSCTVRVYLPPFEEWENRSGASFGMRADVRGRKPDGTMEPYWPGMFWLFRKAGKNVEADFAQLTIRSGPRGNDVRSLKATEPGWWTMGLSFTPDGQVHYYARQGVEDLTADDYLASYFPYNNKAMTFNNFFFNVANWDNGRSWSTKWVIDDPKIFVIPPDGHAVAELYKPAPKPKQVARKRGSQGAGNSRAATKSQSRPQR